MIDIEIHGTGGRSTEARSLLLGRTRTAFKGAAYEDLVTFVDANTDVLDSKGVQTKPFIRIYGQSDQLRRAESDIRNRLRGMFSLYKMIEIAYLVSIMKE